MMHYTCPTQNKLKKLEAKTWAGHCMSLSSSKFGTCQISLTLEVKVLISWYRITPIRLKLAELEATDSDPQANYKTIIFD